MAWEWLTPVVTGAVGMAGIAGTVWAGSAGRNAAGRADACWLPIAPGLTPHGLRHSYKTLMVELRTPAKLMDAQMGHADGSIGALYTHVTPVMVEGLLDGLTDLWAAALRERYKLCAGSPVAVLDRLLREVSA